MSATQMRIAACLAACVGMGLPAAFGQNLIDCANGAGAGSFELGAFTPTGTGYMRLGPESSVVTGWFVTGASGVDWLESPHRAAVGTRSMDLKGTIEGDFGGVYTVIPTVPGGEYTLSFLAYGGNYANTGLVSVGDLVNQPFSPPAMPDVTIATYQLYVFPFHAVAPMSALMFTSDVSVGFGPVIDDVRVVGPSVGACPCSMADITGIGGPPAIPDGLITGDDFNAFIAAFAAGDALADITGIGGPPAIPDGLITGDDFNTFIAAFAAGCP